MPRIQQPNHLADYPYKPTPFIGYEESTPNLIESIMGWAQTRPVDSLNQSLTHPRTIKEIIYFIFFIYSYNFYFVF